MCCKYPILHRARAPSTIAMTEFGFELRELYHCAKNRRGNRRTSAWHATRSGRQATIRTQMAHKSLAIAPCLQQDSQIVMRIRVGRVKLQAALITALGVVKSSHLL